ncbi:TPA: tryptophan--tRNA ligase [Candidatus Uhrbacteria bacterium]|uniref:Tryptophan--tRNA ligase n=2 Tax=Candidatus Uhriibacteriota TaxID=1752732 RepID=A0A0G1Q5L0_9BACT|nr:MAG: Tryptophan-tRNA ligase [Candidatus Uhrbacteria bacterium GW2011_GWF2_46_218]KKU40107.1 MAG: Tryptophan-tRNA ligase [Candidatus Uhrbacteria bacterium GW2011_GWE2_46_68]HBK34331.1 tryptophan--tRNA ligase [Candidatus Uhrbacteria bacterium]HCB19625.1 tryptophan--tRNA ligase [Candidatus Uhrbacteria bacterium]
MSRVLTALQPSGVLHIGNYFGAIEPLLDLQEHNENHLFIVDYHAITVPQDPAALRKNILYATAVYLAAGIDPNKTILFQQSRVPQHTELGWILNCFTYMGELERMTQFKDKSRGKGESVSIGLFDYPVLMAADILLYDTQVVPVGEDQVQHVELARDIAKRFNNRFGEVFTIPEVRIRQSGARLMGLDDPTKKMSKSAESPRSYISLQDSPEEVEKKIKTAVTDSESTIVYDPEHRPAIANLLTIYSLVSKKTTEEIVMNYEGKGYGPFKTDLAAAINTWLQPIQEKTLMYLKDEDQLRRILDMGAQKAKEKAEKTMQRVRQTIGIIL